MYNEESKEKWEKEGTFRCWGKRDTRRSCIYARLDARSLSDRSDPENSMCIGSKMESPSLEEQATGEMVSVVVPIDLRDSDTCRSIAFSQILRAIGSRQDSSGIGGT